MTGWQLLSQLRALASPLVRRRLMGKLRVKAWPILRVLATWHRASLGGRTRLTVVIGSFGKTTTTSVARAALGLQALGQAGNVRTGLALGILTRTPWHPTGSMWPITPR